MKDQFKTKAGKEIRKMDKIFEQISGHYKDESEEFLSKKKLDDLLYKDLSENIETKEIIEKEWTFTFGRSYSFLKIGNKAPIRIDFIVKCNFINEEKTKFYFWVCSFEYLKEKLQALGYKEAKINKKKYFFKKMKKMKKILLAHQVNHWNMIKVWILNFQNMK